MPLGRGFILNTHHTPKQKSVAVFHQLHCLVFLISSHILKQLPHSYSTLSNSHTSPASTRSTNWCTPSSSTLTSIRSTRIYIMIMCSIALKTCDRHLCVMRIAIWRISRRTGRRRVGDSKGCVEILMVYLSGVRSGELVMKTTYLIAKNTFGCDEDTGPGTL